MPKRTAFEGIYDAILHSKGKMITVYLTSGIKFSGVLHDMTYFNEGDKQKERPRMLTLISGDEFYYIDAIKIDAMSNLGGLECTAKSAKKK